MVPTCPRCGKYVTRDAALCPHCGFKADFAEIAAQDHQRREALMRERDSAWGKAELQAEAEREAKLQASLAADRAEKQASTIPILTLAYMPGYRVIRAVGIVSAQGSLGNLALNQMLSGLAGSLRTKGVAENDSTTAYDSALADLKRAAFGLGGNAVLGAAVELAAVGEFAFYTVTGTAVVVQAETGGESSSGLAPREPRS